MKAIVFDEPGGPENLSVRIVDDPVCKENQVIIDIKFAALNHLDLWVRKSPTYAASTPHVGGSDGSGTISEIGTKVKNLNLGDRVLINPGFSCGNCRYCYMGEQSSCDSFKIMGAGPWGTEAEKIAVDAKNVLKIPDNITFEVAAAAPLTFITVYRMLATKGNVQPGETVLVTGGGGGIGTVAIQMAKAMKAKVIVLTSTDKIEAVHQLGADVVINYLETPDWENEVINEGGADVIIESVGEKTWGKSIKVLNKRGRLVTIGATTGALGETEIRELYRKQASIHGSFMGSNEDFLKSMNFLFDGSVKPVIDSVFKLSDARLAHERLETGKHIGKILLQV
ncbi:MAG: NAD-dependent alcohol dehydrogenase [Candidatus Heimdallarchaeota archaeon LC_2]|nr:MAG: NAD-dependent alcohol dehydrogenase [Candidatus Heimdallarchaeota archaeon LC_2]